LPRRESVLHQQALIVTGFFSGFALTALVVIIQAPTAFHVAVGPLSADEYFQALTTSIAVVASICVFGVLAAMEMAAGLAEEGSAIDKFGFACFLTGLFGLVGVLPLLLLPFSHVGSVILIGLEIILLFVYFASPTRVAAKTRR